jgi:hypothetical protein
MKAARTFPEGEKLVPLVLLKGGKAKNGEWAFCVPESRVEHVRNLIETGHIPTEDGVMTCINEAGETSFFEVSMRNFGGWQAPNIFEEVPRCFDLPKGIPIDCIDGKEPMPIKGVIFVKENGEPLVHQSAEGKGVPLRYNLTNFEAAGGTISEDKRVWSITVGGTEYTGHLWLVNSENAMRIFGSIAYVMVCEKAPESVIVCESAASIASLVAQHQDDEERLKGAQYYHERAIGEAKMEIQRLRTELETANAMIAQLQRNDLGGSMR